MVGGKVCRLVERLAPVDAKIASVGVPERAESLDRGRDLTSRDGTTTVMSMIGLAASPGTAVLPTCSIPIARSFSAGHTRARSRSNTSGHAGS